MTVVGDASRAARLIVVIGAGASYDCASGRVEPVAGWRPPLVKELFEQRFSEILHEYPLAEQIAPDIRIAVESGAVGLEAYLRDQLRRSPYPQLRRRYQAVPLYLQHLLWEAGRSYARHPDNYDRLVTAALRLQHATYITLNYDTILDRRLAIDAPVDSLDDYIHPERNWSLVKLHGSINWGRPVEGEALHESRLPLRMSGAQTFAEAYARLEEDPQLGAEIVVNSGDSLEEFRLGEVIQRTHVGALRQMFYPALSVPLGSEDEIVCPEEHVEHARQQLQSGEGLNLLVVGYSGLDEEVLKLLASANRPVKTIRVVNGSTEASFNSVREFAASLGFEPIIEMAFSGTFTDFAQGDGLHEYLAGLA